MAATRVSKLDGPARLSGSTLLVTVLLLSAALGSPHASRTVPAVSQLTSVVISTSQNLSADLVTGNVTINPGVTLTTDGFSIIVSGTFNNEGTVVTGLAPPSTYPTSYGGSGGGSQSLNFCTYDQNGSSTLAQGGSHSCSNNMNGATGGTPTLPSLSSLLISSWYSAGMVHYLPGASGGAISGYIRPGSGAFGVYISAGTLTAGSISAAGQRGEGTCSGIGLSGGGGGGTILLAYGTGGYTPGNFNVSGGPGVPSCAGNVFSGSGGKGQVLTFNYGSSQPPTGSSSSPLSSLSPLNLVLIVAVVVLAVALASVILLSRRKKGGDRTSPGTPSPPSPPTT